VSDLFNTSSAEFSKCGTYRFELRRIWDNRRPPLVFVMLNPSTADAHTDDPTVARCRGRAWDGGYGGLVVVNIFALRSTDPIALRTADDPIGPDNDHWIMHCARGAGRVVCAWGAHGNNDGRGEAVRKMLTDAGIRLHALGFTMKGEPRHPLYVRSDEPLVRWITPFVMYGDRSNV
jgi:hypothetical protein